MKRILLVIAALLFLLLAGGFVAFKASPWPSVWLLGKLMNDQGDASSHALIPHVPPGIVSRLDLRYGKQADERFDLFLPPNADRPLPAIVWIHGGGFISGNKEAVANYIRILASHGYAGVSLEYAKGRGHPYPVPVQQVNAALGYLVTHAAELGIDPDVLVLAGDSAGAQIASQVALLTTDPAYAARLGITPTIPPERLRALVLASGAFDLGKLHYEGKGSWLTNTMMWAYTGKRRFLDDPDVMLASINQHVTAAFPPSFIASGNADPLEPQARRLVARLDTLGVPTTSVFFDKDHAPAQPHEFQFNLDGDEGQRTLEAMMEFLRERAPSPEAGEPTGQPDSGKSSAGMRTTFAG